jgi:polyvinyl alcohol dehydrogenase (cytochrome)
VRNSWEFLPRLSTTRLGLAGVAFVVSGALLASSGAFATVRRANVPHTVPSAADWPTYGHDPQHTFHGRTTITRANVGTLRQAWSFPTGDAVTATPTVVAGTVYVGSWDGYFYAIALRTGKLRWRFHLDPQPAVSPQPGQTPRDITSDGGLVTSSAWFEPGSGTRPDLVLFGGGFTLYALDAHSGRLVWKHAYTGNPGRPPDPVQDGTRIFSSPVVASGKVIIGISVGDRGQHGYVVAASLASGQPVWTYQTDVGANGRVRNDGCGSVWSSGTLLPKPNLVVFDVADCNFSNPPPLSETVFALHIDNGRRAWLFRPGRADQQCDTDFGATANAGVRADGTPTFLGVGSKDGTYYSLDPATGRLRWQTNVVFGGFSGGFIATAAYDGSRVYGATALGDFGRFEAGTSVHCAPNNPRDVSLQEPSVHTFNAATGAIAWQAEQAPAFGPTTVAGGFTFHGIALRDVVQVRDASSGAILAELPTLAPCWSGVATVGNAVIFGTGASHQGAPDGVVAYTPGGTTPRG